MRPCRGDGEHGSGGDRNGDYPLHARRVLRLPDPFDAVASLEGKWISPDPLAFAIRSDSKGLEDLAPVLAAEPRRAEAVIGEREVTDALRERLRPAARYRVRFFTRAPAPGP